MAFLLLEQIDIWDCHPPDAPNKVDDMFEFDASTKQIRPVKGVADGQCFSLMNAWPADPLLPAMDPWGGRYKARFEHMMRLLKSAGMNGISLEDVNSCGVNLQILHSPSLTNISRNLGPIMERWGITPYISACYAAPYAMAK